MQVERRRPVVIVCASAALIILAVIAVYGRSLSFDLFWDDYASLRPRSPALLRAVWFGPWDPVPDGWGPYYRPLSIWYYASMFHLFALNAWPLHVVSLMGTAVIAGLIGLFAWRETARAGTAVLAAVLYVVFPPMAFATGVWFSNQFHQLASVCVLGALLAWQRARVDGTWWKVWAWSCAGFLIKEDTFLIAPAVLVIQWLRARIAGDLPRPSARVCVATLAGCVALWIWRTAMVGGIEEFLGPPWYVFTNLRRGPLRVLGVLPRLDPFVIAGALLTAAAWIAGGVAAWRDRRAPMTGLWITGVCLFVVFNAPLAIASNLSRYHLIGIGAVLMISSGASVMLTRASSRLPRPVVVVALLAACLTLTAANHVAQDEYRPCSSLNLARDGDIVDWTLVPSDLQEWIRAKPARCRAGTYQSILDSTDLVAWGLAPASPGDPGIRWADEWTVVLAHRSAHTARFVVDHPNATASTPVAVEILGDGGERAFIRLSSSSPHAVPFPLRDTWLSDLRAMHRIDVRVTTRASPSGVRVQITLE